MSEVFSTGFNTLLTTTNLLPPEQFFVAQIFGGGEFAGDRRFVFVSKQKIGFVKGAEKIK